MNKQVYELTKEGVSKLRLELDELKDVKRPEVLKTTKRHVLKVTYQKMLIMMPQEKLKPY